MKSQSLYAFAYQAFLFLLGMSVVLTACVDTIRFDLPKDEATAIVIQAKLLKGSPNRLDVRVQRLFAFGPSSRDIVNVKEVFLVDVEGSRLAAKRIGDGIFELEFFDGQLGFSINYFQAYSLEVNLGDGRSFKSSAEPLLPVPQMDSISFALISELVPDPIDPEDYRLASFAEYSINTPLDQGQQVGNARLRWEMERTFKLTETPFDGFEPRTCYVNDPVSVYLPQAFDGTLINSDYLNDYKLYIEWTESYFYPEGYYTSVFQESLSEGAYKYFSQIQNSVLRNGNMFESPAGALITNFKNEDNVEDPVYGYFYVTERDTIHLYTAPSQVNYPDTFCLRNFDFTPEFCINCLSFSRSDTVPPPFWKE